MMDYICVLRVNRSRILYGHGERWISFGEQKYPLLKLSDLRWKFFLYYARYSEERVGKVLVMTKQSDYEMEECSSGSIELL